MLSFGRWTRRSLLGPKPRVGDQVLAVARAPSHCSKPRYKKAEVQVGFMPGMSTARRKSRLSAPSTGRS